MIEKILLVGLGDLGNQILRLLCTEAGVGSILVASRDARKGEEACNLARLAAGASGCFPFIRFAPIDLNREDRVSELVAREEPDLVIHTATMMTWWLPDLLPDPQKSRIREAGFGAWLPVHLTLTLRLLRALQKAGYRGFTMTAPYPDVVNAVLAKLGLVATCGMGNLDELVPRIQIGIAERQEIAPSEVRVWLVGHHAFESAVLQGRREDHPPYFLRVELQGQVLVCPDEVLWREWPIPAGPAIHFLTAACAVRATRALGRDSASVIHVPGPNGFPGGYPVEASSAGIRFCDIPGISLEEATRINEESHRFDGIERIEEDGTVLFSAEKMEILRQEFGYYCPRLRPAESADYGNELISKFRNYARRAGIADW